MVGHRRQNEQEKAVFVREHAMTRTGRRIEIVACAELLGTDTQATRDNEEFFAAWMAMIFARRALEEARERGHSARRMAALQGDLRSLAPSREGPFRLGL